MLASRSLAGDLAEAWKHDRLDTRLVGGVRAQ
jgi:hypothetical protein